MRCYRRLLNISYKDHVTNEKVRIRIQNAIGVHDYLLTMAKKRKLRWYGRISRSSGMAKTILQGTVKGTRRRGRQKKRWDGNGNSDGMATSQDPLTWRRQFCRGQWKEQEEEMGRWTEMGFGGSLGAKEDREGWKVIVAMSSVVPRRPSRLRVWDEIRWKHTKPKEMSFFFFFFLQK